MKLLAASLNSRQCCGSIRTSSDTGWSHRPGSAPGWWTPWTWCCWPLSWPTTSSRPVAWSWCCGIGRPFVSGPRAWRHPCWAGSSSWSASCCSCLGWSGWPTTSRPRLSRLSLVGQAQCHLEKNSRFIFKDGLSSTCSSKTIAGFCSAWLGDRMGTPPTVVTHGLVWSPGNPFFLLAYHSPGYMMLFSTT